MLHLHNRILMSTTDACMYDNSLICEIVLMLFYKLVCFYLSFSLSLSPSFLFSHPHNCLLFFSPHIPIHPYPPLAFPSFPFSSPFHSSPLLSSPQLRG